MPGGGYRQAREPARIGTAARRAQGSGRRDPLRDVRGAGPLDRRPLRVRPRRAPRDPRQHRPPAPGTAPRGRPGRRRGRPPGHRRASPAPLLPERRRAGPRLRPSGPCAARRPARRARRAGGRRCRRGRRDRPGLGCRRRPTNPLPELSDRARGRAREARIRACVRTRRRRRHRPDRIPALPVPGAGRGLPRAGVQPAPGTVRGRRRRRRRGNSRGVRDVVRPGAVPRHGGVGYPESRSPATT